MQHSDNNNRGSLFRNDKRGNERAPDYTGKCTVDGVEMRIAAWVKESPGKPKFFSLKFTPADEGRAAPPAPAKEAPRPQAPDEDLPF